MQLEEVVGVLNDLQRAGCPAWLAGGWGVDALLGRQTREHRDLDLLVRAQDEQRVLEVLALRRYVIETDWRPVRVELHAECRGWVDLHPVVFDTTGHGRQAGLDGGSYEYRPHDFTTGYLADLPVTCLTAQRQLQLHSGYEPRDVDRHDVDLLRALIDAPGHDTAPDGCGRPGL